MILQPNFKANGAMCGVELYMSTRFEEHVWSLVRTDKGHDGGEQVYDRHCARIGIFLMDRRGDPKYTPSRTLMNF